MAPIILSVDLIIILPDIPLDLCILTCPINLVISSILIPFAGDTIPTWKLDLHHTILLIFFLYPFVLLPRKIDFSDEISDVEILQQLHTTSTLLLHQIPTINGK